MNSSLQKRNMCGKPGSEKTKADLTEGVFLLEANHINKKQKRIKLTSLILNPFHQSSSNFSINQKIEMLEIYGQDEQLLNCGASVPLVMILKNQLLRADFNEDQIVDQLDYNLLMEHFLEDIVSDS
ncbi:hypothetical protein LLG10_02335 [bacterium]|nr:hypothetical protein [bacterium]